MDANALLQLEDAARCFQSLSRFRMDHIFFHGSHPMFPGAVAVWDRHWSRKIVGREIDFANLGYSRPKLCDEKQETVFRSCHFFDEFGGNIEATSAYEEFVQASCTAGDALAALQTKLKLPLYPYEMKQPPAERWVYLLHARGGSVPVSGIGYARQRTIVTRLVSNNVREQYRKMWGKTRPPEEPIAVDLACFTDPEFRERLESCKWEGVMPEFPMHFASYLKNIVTASLSATTWLIGNAKTNGSVGHGKENETDPVRETERICDTLSGQANLRFRFLQAQNHFTTFNTLKNEQGLFQKRENTTDRSVETALNRLSVNLDSVNAPYTLEYAKAENLKRAKLVRKPPSN